MPVEDLCDIKTFIHRFYVKQKNANFVIDLNYYWIKKATKGIT